MANPTQPLRLFIVAGEHSGDALGGKLIAALKTRLGAGVTFAGVGGEDMAKAGLASLFPIEDVAVMGPRSILPRLPRIVRRVYQTVTAALAWKPDAVVIIDSPEFTHPIAKRIRMRAPELPIIDYVSPSVWAWRPGRAKKMRAYIDEVLALLPFEPAAHVRLGGPHCTYVGHPLIESLDRIQGADGSSLARDLALPPGKPVLVVLPGSRPSEVDRLMGVFGETINALRGEGLAFDVVIPVVRVVRAQVEKETAGWPIKPFLVDGVDDKYRAMRLARAALAASGTVTLELALAGTPTVVAYKVDKYAAPLRFLVKTPTIVLANLVLGENAFPEFLQKTCTAENLLAAVRPLMMAESPERTRQMAALSRIPGVMALAAGTPSEAAAQTVLDVIARHAAGKSRLAGPM